MVASRENGKAGGKKGLDACGGCDRNVLLRWSQLKYVNGLEKKVKEGKGGPPSYICSN